MSYAWERRDIWRGFLEKRRLSALTEDMRTFSRQLTDDNQFRWLGPEKGVTHLAAAALINAVWDLYARQQSKPLWRLLADMSAGGNRSAGGFPIHR